MHTLICLEAWRSDRKRADEALRIVELASELCPDLREGQLGVAGKDRPRSILTSDLASLLPGISASWSFTLIDPRSRVRDGTLYVAEEYLTVVMYKHLRGLYLRTRSIDLTGPWAAPSLVSTLAEETAGGMGYLTASQDAEASALYALDTPVVSDIAAAILNPPARWHEQIASDEPLRLARNLYEANLWPQDFARGVLADPRLAALLEPPTAIGAYELVRAPGGKPLREARALMRKRLFETEAPHPI